VSAVAEILFDICDPKFGCGFGLQFGAGLAGIVAFLAGVVLLCGLAAYTGATGRLVPQRRTLIAAALLGFIVGTVWTLVATGTYMYRTYANV